MLLLVGLVIERIHGNHPFGLHTIVAMGGLLGIAILFAASRRFYRVRPETVQRTWMVLLSGAVAYAVSDLVGGMVLIQPVAFLSDSVVDHRMAPNTVSTVRGPDFVYRLRSNNLGFRGRDVAPEKSPESFRIITLGDSFTMGEGVEDGETFSALLEARLRERPSGVCGRSKVEVLNAGVDSYSPLLSWLQFKNQLAPVPADMVVLNLDMSDLLQEQWYRRGATRDSAGTITGVIPPDLRRGSEASGLKVRVRRWIDRHLVLTRWILAKLTGAESEQAAILDRVNRQLLLHTLASDTVDRRAQWRDLFESIDSIKHYADARSMRFLLTTYPWGHQVSDKEWVLGRKGFFGPGETASDRTEKTIGAMAALRGMDLLDAFPAFQSFRGPPLYYSYDMHWTRRGQALMAQLLETRILELCAGTPGKVLSD